MTVSCFIHTPETQKKPPRHLTFSTNMDIIQVSNIKYDTAQDKWHQKVGESALFGSELQRRAEVAFILRILLRDRPPLEFLVSRNILQPPLPHKSSLVRPSPSSSPSPSYNIEILKYEKADTGGQQVVVYYIDVYRRRAQASCPVHVEPGAERGGGRERGEEDRDRERDSRDSRDEGAGGRVRIYPHKCNCKKWTIRRRYADFDALHRPLKAHLSAPLLADFRLPQKAYVQAVQTSFFYAKRLMGLREYLRSLLLGLPDMAEVRRRRSLNT